jgi:glutamine amidotransferase-like uncharacterized protein
MKVIAVLAEVNNWLRVFKVVNTFLDYGVSVLLCREEVEISGSKLPSGAFIFPLEGVFKELADEDSLEAVAPLSEQEIREYIKSENIPLIKGEVKRGVNITPLTSPRVAFYEDSGCFSHAMVIASSGFNVGWVNGREVTANALDYFDILMSGGGGGAVKANINRENLLLAGYGVEGAKKVAEFVRNGGAYFGCCGGSYVGSNVRERFMNWWHPAKKYMTMMNVEDSHIDEFSDSGFKSPGQGVYTARNVAPDNPVMFGIPETFKCTHWNGPIWNIIEAAVENASSAIPLVKIEDVSADEFTPSEFFRKTEEVNSETLKETGFYRAYVQEKAPIAQGYYGLGLVVLSGSHPEMAPFAGQEVNREELWPSARILSNAAFWSAAQSSRKRKKYLPKRTPRLLFPIASQKEAISSVVKSCMQAAETLKKKSLTPLPFWLRPELYSLAFNLTPKKRYLENLNQLPVLCETLVSQFEIMDQLTEKVLKTRDEISGMLSTLKDDEHKERILHSLRDKGLELVFTYYSMLGSRKCPQWYQGGNERFQGIHDLLNIAESNAEAAVERASILDNLDETSLSPVDISNNPYSKLRATSSRLSGALKLLWVNESAMEKFLTLWRIFQKRV